MRALSHSLQAARAVGLIPVIPDFKMISPKDGPLFSHRDPVEWAKQMEALGAPGLSVVTEPKDFGGSLDLLERITSAVSIPVLRKDFISGIQDLKDTVAGGAQAILLILSCMTAETAERLYHASLEMGLEPLVEAHTAQELALAERLGARLVGINNRNILALEKDGGTVSTTGALAALKPSGSVLVSESGILTPADARAAMAAGADAVLVGTAIWQAPDPAAFYRSLTEAEGTAGE